MEASEQLEEYVPPSQEVLQQKSAGFVNNQGGETAAFVDNQGEGSELFVNNEVEETEEVKANEEEEALNVNRILKVTFTLELRCMSDLSIFINPRQFYN